MSILILVDNKKAF